MLTLWFFLVALPGVQVASANLAILFGFGSIAAGFGAALTHLEEGWREEAKKWSKRAAYACPICFAAFVTLASLLPDTEQMYVLIGGSYATNIEGIDKLPPAIVNAVEAWLERVADGAE